MSNAEPEALVSRVLAGDASAWLALWLAVEPKLYATLRRRSFVGRLSDSEEDCRKVVTCVRARVQANDFERLRAFAEAQGAGVGLPFLAWLLVVAKRVAIEQMREDAGGRGETSLVRPSTWRLLDALVAESRKAGAGVPDLTTAEGILRCASDLPPREKDALAAWLGGKSYVEIARTQELADEIEAEQAVRAALERLRDRARREEDT
jgi:DNA-directed RNA polymerase specialized sigma24 family protein